MVGIRAEISWISHPNPENWMMKMAMMPRDEAIFTIIETEFPTLFLEAVEDLARKLKKGMDLDSAIESLLASEEYYKPSDERLLREAYARFEKIEKLTDEEMSSLAEAVELKSSEQEASKSGRLLQNDKRDDGEYAVPAIEVNAESLAKARRTKEKARKSAVSRHHKTLLLLLYALLHADVKSPPKKTPAKLAHIDSLFRGVLGSKCPHSQTLDKVMSEIEAQFDDLQAQLNDLQIDLKEL
jgi:hypothetical protein